MRAVPKPLAAAGPELGGAADPATSRRRWVGIAEIALSGLGFGFLGVFGKAAYRAGLTVEPVAGVLVATALLGEHLTAQQLLGGALVLAALVYLATERRRS